MTSARSAALQAQAQHIRTLAAGGLCIMAGIILFMMMGGLVTLERQLGGTIMFLTMGAWCIAGAYFVKYVSILVRIILSVVPTGLTALSLYFVILVGQSLGSAL